MTRVALALLVLLLPAPAWAEAKDAPAIWESEPGGFEGFVGVVCNSLGQAREYGFWGLSQDTDKAAWWYGQAAVWLKASADKGFPIAQHVLATLYHEGHGVSLDYDKAIYWYTKAAENGESGAYYNLGEVYARREDKTQDRRKAWAMFHKAAALGSAQERYRVGWRYAVDIGIPPDFVEAYAWLRVSEAQARAGLAGRPDLEKQAASGLQFVTSKLSPADLARAQARAKEYYQKYVVEVGAADD
jgi:TPR repeat protein